MTMAETNSGTRINILRLILIPGVITLAVTLLRLVGELQHWSPILFKPSAGGLGSIIGISWLPFIFGIYFALKLSREGEMPVSLARGIGLPILGVAIIMAGGFAGGAMHLGFQSRAILQYGTMFVAGIIQYPAWPALFKVLLAYGLTARVPVAILMWFAMAGN